MRRRKLYRREFIKTAGIAAACLGSSRLVAGDPAGSGTMPYRQLGKTGEKISLLGVGGFHIGTAEEREAVRIVQEAIDNGVNFFDNAWEYNGGRSEEYLGKGLQGRREKAFVMTKHHGRDKKVAMAHLEDSLRRLRTDTIDLWMFHEVIYDADPDMIFAPGGGIEAAELARKQGKVRYIGFTGHKWPRVHLKMLAYGYPWDAVLMPMNILDGTYRSFEKWVLPVLVKRGIAPLAMKTRAGGSILRAGAATAEECWRYVAGLPVSTIVSGMESRDILQKNLALARESEPMNEKDREAIRQRTREVALQGTLELFKSSRRYDSAVGRRLHGVQ